MVKMRRSGSSWASREVTSPPVSTSATKKARAERLISCAGSVGRELVDSSSSHALSLLVLRCSASTASSGVTWNSPRCCRARRTSHTRTYPSTEPVNSQHGVSCASSCRLGVPTKRRKLVMRFTCARNRITRSGCAPRVVHARSSFSRTSRALSMVVTEWIAWAGASKGACWARSRNKGRHSAADTPATNIARMVCVRQCTYLTHTHNLVRLHIRKDCLPYL